MLCSVVSCDVIFTCELALFLLRNCEKHVTNKAPTKKQIAEEAVAAAVAQAQNPSEAAVMASLDAKRRKVIRPKSDPLMPKGGVEPNDWMELGKLEEGVRGILVSVWSPFLPLRLGALRAKRDAPHLADFFRVVR